MENVIKSGALGVEIILSGKIPSSRATNWRFYQGYLKKCGDIAVEGVRKAQASALLKSGTIGVKVAIMPPDLQLPDRIDVLEQAKEIVEVISENDAKKKNSKKNTAKKKSSSSRKGSKRNTEEKIKDETVEEAKKNIEEVKKDEGEGKEKKQEEQKTEEKT